MCKILDGLEGVVCLMDDVLVFGKDQEEHDQRLRQVLERVEAANVTLNPSKCEFSKTEVKFLGHVIDRHGLRSAPEKKGPFADWKRPSLSLRYAGSLEWLTSSGNSLHVLLSSVNLSGNCSTLNERGSGDHNKTQPLR